MLLGMEDLKLSVSKVLLGKKASLVQSESSAVCVKHEEVCGHLITLVEMPVLSNSQLSEQEVMRQTLHCVSVCDPGVHAFIIVVHEGPLTDEDKAEIDTFQKIFSSRVNDHTIFIINQQSQREQLHESVIKAYGGRYTFYSSSTETEKLFSQVQDLLKENISRQYTMAMYSEAQLETHLQYKRENISLKEQIKELKIKDENQTQGKILINFK